MRFSEDISIFSFYLTFSQIRQWFEFYRLFTIKLSLIFIKRWFLLIAPIGLIYCPIIDIYCFWAVNQGTLFNFCLITKFWRLFGVQGYLWSIKLGHLGAKAFNVVSRVVDAATFIICSGCNLSLALKSIFCSIEIHLSPVMLDLYFLKRLLYFIRKILSISKFTYEYSINFIITLFILSDLSFKFNFHLLNKIISLILIILKLFYFCNSIRLGNRIKQLLTEPVRTVFLYNLTFVRLQYFIVIRLWI